MTPIQGDWTIDAIGLPASVLRKIYFDNARKLLVRSLPPSATRARHINLEISPGNRRGSSLANDAGGAPGVFIQ